MVFVRQTGISRTSHVPPTHSFFKKKSILKNLCQICGNLFFPAYYIGEGPVRGAVQSAVMYILSSENEKKESSHTTT